MNWKHSFNKLSPGLSNADVDDSTVFKISPTDYETTLLQRIDNCDYVALANEQLLSNRLLWQWAQVIQSLQCAELRTIQVGDSPVPRNSLAQRLSGSQQLDISIERSNLSW